MIIIIIVIIDMNQNYYILITSKFVTTFFDTIFWGLSKDFH